jgi:hypothetical protein
MQPLQPLTTSFYAGALRRETHIPEHFMIEMPFNPLAGQPSRRKAVTGCNST